MWDFSLNAGEGGKRRFSFRLDWISFEGCVDMPDHKHDIEVALAVRLFDYGCRAASAGTGLAAGGYIGIGIFGWVGTEEAPDGFVDPVQNSRQFHHTSIVQLFLGATAPLL